MKYNLLLIVLTFVFLSGCGDGRPKRYPVQGKLLLDGKQVEVPEGFIGVAALTFQPEAGGRDAFANLNPDGTFQIGNYEAADGCPLGKFRVGVQFYRLVGSNKATLIPLRYEDPKKSGLTVEIGKETKEITVEITKK